MHLAAQEKKIFNENIRILLPDQLNDCRGNAIVSLLLDSLQEGHNLSSDEFLEVKELMRELSQYYYDEKDEISNESLRHLYTSFTKVEVALQELNDSQDEPFFKKIHTKENIMELKGFYNALSDICHMFDTHVE